MKDNNLNNSLRHIFPDEEQSSEEIYSIWASQSKMYDDKDLPFKEIQDFKQKQRLITDIKNVLKDDNVGDRLDSSRFSFKWLSKHKVRSLIRKFNFRKFNIQSFRTKKPVIAIFIALPFIIVATILVLNNNNTEQSQTATLGESNAKIPIADALPREKPSTFSLLLPQNLSESDYDIVRISPDDADASYTYLDRFTDSGTIFRVTQQQVPENFNLQEVATDFQATSIIQVDDITVYHGYSERGRVQSLLFIKEDVLVTIRSSEKFDDDQWASYVISLQ